MAGFDLTAASNILKEFYLPPIQKLLNNATVLLKYVDKDSSTFDVEGKNFTIPLHIGRNEAAAVGRNENETLPTAGNQKFGKATVPSKYIYSRIQLSGPVIRAARSQAGAFIKATTREVEGVTDDTKRALNRQLHGNGVDALGYFVSGAGSTNVVVDDSLGNSFTLLEDVTTVDLLDVSNSYAALNSGITITPGSDAAGGINATLSSAANGISAAGDVFVVASTKGKQVMGIQGIVDDQDPPLLANGLHNILVASNARWKAQVVGSDSTKVDLSFANLQKVLSLISSRSAKDEKDVKLILCNYPERDAYVALAVAERMHVNTMTLDGGFEAVEYNGKAIVPDPQCRRNRFYFIVPDSLGIYRMADFDWMDMDGSMWNRVPNTDAYEATMYCYMDLGCKYRNANGVLKGVLS